MLYLLFYKPPKALNNRLNVPEIAYPVLPKRLLFFAFGCCLCCG